VTTGLRANWMRMKGKSVRGWGEAGGSLRSRSLTAESGGEIERQRGFGKLL